MKFTLQYPIAHAGYSPELLTPGGVRRLVTATEAAGFDAIAFTEHPAPSAKWMAAGGHASFDPLTALAVCAGVTAHIRLQAYLLVLPYRNPFLAAKQATTLDLMSGGRLILGVGVGYLRSEFLALGVEFEERNALFDESLEVMAQIWSEDNVAHDGLHFKALDQTISPRPSTGPPIWVGGNGKRARQRVVASGNGWCPLIMPADRAKTTRTAAIEGPAELRQKVDELHELAASQGRSGDHFDVQVEWKQTALITEEPESALELIGQLDVAGATWIVVDPPADDLGQTVDLIASYGESVIASAR